MGIKKITEELMNHAVKLIEEGLSIKITSEIVGVHETSLRPRIKKMGIEITKTIMGKAFPEAEIVQAYSQGKSTVVLAKEYSTSTGNISRILNKYDTKMRTPTQAYYNGKDALYKSKLVKKLGSQKARLTKEDMLVNISKDCGPHHLPEHYYYDQEAHDLVNTFRQYSDY